MRNIGITMIKSIIIRESLQKSVTNIYANGDVVVYSDLISNAFAVSAQWTNAEEMGRLAGMSMAGMAISYDGFPSLLYRSNRERTNCGAGTD
jgi:NADPH-dependent 2,4-dienoyl-CoA reductase/sulfur reductase-like enzyme